MITVLLGGQEYEVKTLSIKKSREWRKKLAGPFEELLAVIKNANSIELTSVQDLAGIAVLIQERIIQAPDLCLELLCAYSPEIKADLKRIEDQATDEEVMVGLTQVLKLAYPFGAVPRLLRGAG